MLVTALALGVSVTVAVEQYASGHAGRDPSAATIACPDVGEALRVVPEDAGTTVNRQLARLDTTPLWTSEPGSLWLCPPGHSRGRVRGTVNPAEEPLSIAFLLTTLAVVVTPGTGVVYTLATAVAHGRRASLVAACGCTLGIVPHLAATITGLAALLHTSSVAYEAVRFLGVGYLLYMAWATLRDKEALAVEGAGPPRPALRVIASGVLVNLLNPKLTMFFVAFLPQFVPTGASGSLGAMLRLSAVFMALTLVVFTAYGVCAAAVRDRVLARPRVMTGIRRVFALCFVGLSARLAVA